MAKGEKRVAISTASGGMFSGGKKSAQHVGLDCAPETAIGVTIGLVAVTLALHIIGRFL